MKHWTRGIVCLAGCGFVAGPAAAQTPAATGVVVVRPADEAEASGAARRSEARLGFVAGEAQVIAGVGAGATAFVVSDAGGAEHAGRLVAADEAPGLALLAVPGLTAPPYRFARDPAEAGQEVHGATRSNASDAVALVAGSVRDVDPGAASDPGLVRHDAFNSWQRNVGAPLLNICGEVVGAAVRDEGTSLASFGSGLAVPAAWLLERFAAAGLTATVADTPCLTVEQRAAVAEAAAAAAESRAAAEAERRRRSEAVAAEARTAAEQAAAAEAEQRSQAAAAAEARQQAEARASEAQRQAAAQRARYIRWSAVAAVGAAAAALLFWAVTRRSVAEARAGQREAEDLAQAAESDLAGREAREQLAKAVPAVFLDGADADGRRVALRIPASAIAGANGAVVGRSPFDSTVVLDHAVVSRRHFRLFARGPSVRIEDLQSTNGTTLDDVPLRPGADASLRGGADLRVGSLRFTVTLQA